MFAIICALLLCVTIDAAAPSGDMHDSVIAQSRAFQSQLRREVHSQQHQECIDKYEKELLVLEDPVKRPDCLDYQEGVQAINYACAYDNSTLCEAVEGCSWHETDCYMTGNTTQQLLEGVCTNPCFRDSLINLRELSDCTSKILGPAAVLDLERTLATQRLFCAHRDPNTFCLSAFNDLEANAGVCYMIADLGCCYKELLLAGFEEREGASDCINGELESCGDPFQDQFYVVGVLSIDGINASYFELNREEILLGIRRELSDKLDIPMERIAISGDSAHDEDNTLTVPFTIYAYSKEEQNRANNDIEQLLADSGFSFPLIEEAGGRVNPSKSSTTTTVLGGLIGLFSASFTTTPSLLVSLSLLLSVLSLSVF